MKFLKFLSLIIVILSHNLLYSTSISYANTYTLPNLDNITFQSNDKLTLEQLIEKIPDSVSIDDPLLVLINYDNLIDSEFDIPLAYSYNGIPYHQLLHEPLTQLFLDAANEGLSLYVLSGYRTIAQQEANRNAQYNQYIASGYSENEALYLVNLFFAPSYGSEHSSGLAIDLLDYSWGSELTTDFQFHPAAQWLASNAHHYGFILRYPENKFDITNINFEPWHFRYVGYEHAQFMYEYDLTLEEYLALIAQKQKTTH